jgi:cytochrome c556
MRRHVKFASVVACVAGTATIAWPVAAQFNKPEDAVKYRQAALTVLSNHMGRINTQLKSPTPNIEIIQSSAAVVESMSKLPWEGFGHATEFVAVKTRALPELFKNEAKVKDLAEKMQEEATKLNSVAKTGDAKAVRTQFGVLAKSCDNCHDDFRAK